MTGHQVPTSQHRPVRVEFRLSGFRARAAAMNVLYARCAGLDVHKADGGLRAGARPMRRRWLGLGLLGATSASCEPSGQSWQDVRATVGSQSIFEGGR
jgi:hypothetical protein